MTTLFRGCESKGVQIAKRNWDDVIVAQDRKSIEETLATAQHRAILAAQTPDGDLPPRAQMIFCILEFGVCNYLLYLFSHFSFDFRMFMMKSN